MSLNNVENCTIDSSVSFCFYSIPLPLLPLFNLLNMFKFVAVVAMSAQLFLCWEKCSGLAFVCSSHFTNRILRESDLVSMITWETGESCFFQIPTTFDRFTTPFFRVKNCFPARHQCQKFWGARHPGNKCHRVGKGTGPGCCNQQNT